MQDEVILLARVSDPRAYGENTSTSAQFAAMQADAKAKGQEIIAELEEGITGDTYLGRTALQNALRLIEEKPGRILKMYDFSRYSRNRRIQSEVKERIERAGGKLEFVAERFDNTPEGNLQFNLKGDMVVYERDKTRDRTMNGRRNTAKGTKASAPYKQQPSRSMVPWGFVVPTKADIIRGTYPSEALGRYLIVPENRHILAIVAAMFSRYAMQESYNNIGEWLEASEVLPPKHERTGKRDWSGTSVRCILQNTVYKGYGVFGRKRSVTDENRLARGLKSREYQVYTDESEWELIPEIYYFDPSTREMTPADPVVSPELFDLVQQLMAANWEANRGSGKHKYMLSGLLRCPECGRPMCGQPRPSRDKTRVYVYYVCSQAYNKKQPCKLGKHLRADQAETTLIEFLVALSAQPRYIKEALEEYEKDKFGGNSVAAKRDALQSHAERLFQLRLNALRRRDEAEVDGKTQDVKDNQANADKYLAEREECLKKIEALGADRPGDLPQPTEHSDKIRRILDDVLLALTAPELDGSRKRAILKTIVHSIVPQTDGTMRINLRGEAFVQLIQTDCAINPGNSGGALVNLQGQVIGINTLIISRAQGLGFAIPIDTALQVADELKRHGHVKRPWLGIAAITNSASLASYNDLPNIAGAVAAKLYPGSPSDTVGLRVGDVITKINTKPISSADEFKSVEKTLRIGDKVKMEVHRADQYATVGVIVGEAP